ncbi:MAG: trehalose-phosphatase [Candidatus Thermoplasmatota archaeon]|nr:trehalose-phosphatase [Candidatus Thermoplasmatota archaeon]
MPKYLFDELNSINKLIEESNCLLLFLDYDGTMVYFKEKPRDVKTPKQVKQVLTQLCKKQKFSIFIVTGRGIKEIKNLVDVKGICYAALHGLIVEFSDGTRKHWNPSKSDQKLIESIIKNAQIIFKKESGVLIEDKDYTVAFHYRMVPKDVKDKLIESFLDLVRKIDTLDRLDVLRGAEVIEVRPSNWNKGKFVEFIVDEFILNENVLLIYIGDDTTDEDAFSYLNNKGITVFVKNNEFRDTKAEYWVDNPKKVLEFLKLISKDTSEKNTSIN